jgi:hypothetical protein
LPSGGTGNGHREQAATRPNQVQCTKDCPQGRLHGRILHGRSSRFVQQFASYS